MTTLMRRGSSPFSSIFPELLNPERLLGKSMMDLERRLWDTDRNFDVPSLNVRETEKEYMVDIVAPGFEKKDFKVEFSEGMVTVHAEKEHKEEETQKDYTHREFSYTSIERSFSLPENIREEKIDAKYENGILQLHIPKKDVGKPKITKEIKVS
ncbi:MULTISPECIES: Hsp20/alpha crystallin family protein [Rhodonellum]|nr:MULTISPECIES: Hsp20/alpha crystallin family protein [Rhodonellum]MDO9553962.1 Hsp20/alpha crystallin family protein [Rhodonellum sp.]SDZ45879.1 HSP20 family protein [Rhodonellum ikkaensis]